MIPAFLMVFSFLDNFLINFLEVRGKISKKRLSKIIKTPSTLSIIDSVIFLFFIIM